MKRISLQLLCRGLGLGLLLAAAGCASAGGGGGDGTDSALYREDLGRVLAVPLERAQIKVWGKYNINLYRRETTARGFTYESEWIPRAPSMDETTASVTGARNRVFLRGYQTGENLDGTYIYRVTFEVENQVQSTASPDWHPAPMSGETRSHFRRVFSELQLELRAGVVR